MLSGMTIVVKNRNGVQPFQDAGFVQLVRDVVHNIVPAEHQIPDRQRVRNQHGPDRVNQAELFDDHERRDEPAAEDHREHEEKRKDPPRFEFRSG